MILVLFAMVMHMFLLKLVSLIRALMTVAYFTPIVSNHRFPYLLLLLLRRLRSVYSLSLINRIGSRRKLGR